MNTNLEMLTAREQLMEDIDCIITDYFAEYDVNYDGELVKILCDAVCRNFPASWYKPCRFSSTFIIENRGRE